MSQAFFSWLVPALLAVVACSAAQVPGPVVGGVSPASASDEDVVAAARFAVKEQQKLMRQSKETARARLALVKIESAQRQVVAGLNFKLELKVRADKEQKCAEAIVYRDLSGKLRLTSWNWKP
ncbi:MAG: cystatin domain-containing protein [Verrucomicrobiae bacterium]|nr:cystatin domain-containing protein [Verrucomicrobiae bacterium]